MAHHLVGVARSVGVGGRGGGGTHDGEKTPVDPTDTFLAHDGGCAVEETVVPRFGAFGVLDELGSAGVGTISLELGVLAIGGTDLIVSEGVTLTIASVIPAPNPAVRYPRR